MKVYVIYDKDTMEHPEITGGAPGPFGELMCMVAYTDSEKRARKYIDCRAKKVFKLKTYKMSKRDYVKLVNNYALRELKEFRLTTRNGKSHTSSREVKIVMTGAEHNTLTDETATFGCSRVSFAPIEFFKEKYLIALVKLEYKSIGSVNAYNVGNDDMYGTGWGDDLPDASVDEVAAYININLDDFK